MTNSERIVRLQGRITLAFTITAVTGLHIGGSPGGLAIGNVDNPVIRNPLNGQPYIPGSSLRGKMRSQMEKQYARPQNRSIGRDVRIHICGNANDYRTCPVCKTFGIPGEYDHSEASRLIVRDATLTEESRKLLEAARTDLPFTEVKWEAAIDRVTSAATPRQQERVPGGAKFCGEMSFSLYSFGADESDLSELRLFDNVLEGLELVEEDYLGGQGARGSGRVKFEGITLTVKLHPRVNATAMPPLKDIRSLEELRTRWEDALGKLNR